MAVKSNTALFVQEFKAMMMARQTMVDFVSHRKVQAYSLSMLKGCAGDMQGTEFPKGADVVQIRGIPTRIGDYNYDELNNAYCTLLPKGMELKRRSFLDDNKVARKPDGSIMYTKVPLPKGCVAVATPMRCTLRDSRGASCCQVVDAMKIGGKTQIVYILPELYVYRVNMCSLIISTAKPRSYYVGVEVALTDGRYIYVCSVPYRKANGQNFATLCTATSCTMKKQLGLLFANWYKSGVIFPLEKTVLNEPIEGSFKAGSQRQVLQNIAVRDLEPTLRSYDFAAIGVSLAEEGDKENSVAAVDD